MKLWEKELKVKKIPTEFVSWYEIWLKKKKEYDEGKKRKKKVINIKKNIHFIYHQIYKINEQWNKN
jgi:hypothetical protein